MPFRYQPQWQGPLSGRSFEKQTEDFLNGIELLVGEIDTRQTPSDAVPMPPGTGSAGTSLEYSRGDHSHPLQYNISGNAGSADKLSSSRQISMAGEGLGSASFDGSADIFIPLTVSCTAAGTTEQRPIADRFEDIVNPKDFGAKGDGSTDDTAAFSNLEASISARFVNLCGCSYAVDSEPSGNLYYNGSFVVGGTTAEVKNSKIYIKNSELSGVGAQGQNYFISGDLPEGFTPSRHEIISIGTKAAKNVDSGKNCADVIAIGDGAMSEGHPGLYNIAIGQFALHNVDSDGSTNGYRNTAVGSLSLFGVTTGSYNVGLGRDAGQPITTGTYNVCLGYGAMAGRVPMRLSGKIEVENPVTGSYNICIGHGAGGLLSGPSENNTVVGHNAIFNAKLYNRNCIVGRSAFSSLGIEQSINGKKVILANDSGTYSQSGNTITVSVVGHHAVAGCYVRIKFTSGEIYSQYTRGDFNTIYVDSVVNSSTFTIVSPANLTASGDCIVTEYEQSSNFENSLDDNVCIGYNAGGNALHGNYNVVLGSNAAHLKANSSRVIKVSTVVGGLSAANAESLEGSEIVGFTAGRDAATIANTAVLGYAAGRDAKKLDKTVLLGQAAGNLNVELSSVVAIGVYAMMNSGSNNITNSMAMGYNAQVTGSNQNQIGNQNTTTYCYGAVQDRSDARDKADIRDTELGLDFLLSLRPVDFKWDYREDYIEAVEHEVESLNSDGNPITSIELETVQHEKDGSRKRTRYHHGLIAQEVKAVLDEKGIDFGGYQDHKINGGKDVLTLGYEEFIAPIIKSIQELNSRIAALEA